MKKIILFLSSLFLLSSCSNIFNSLSGTSKNENEYKVTVFVQNEAQSEARSAFPVFKEDANISFGIAYYPTEEGSSSRNKKFLPFDYTAGPIDVSLSPGNWTVYSYRYDGELLETCFESDPVDIVLTTENPSTSVKLIEKPKFQRNDENRIENAVNLPIKVCSDINQIKATWERNGQVYSTTGGKDASGMYYLDLIEYGAPYPYNGTYNVKFDFYGTGSPAPLLYSVMEVVTVYPYCTTTTWTPAASGLEYFSQDASGNWIMDITTTCISKYKLTTFYVDPSATTNNDNPTGDYFAPFTTLESAVTAANNNTTASECTINIRKGQICELESAVTVNGNVTITSYSKNDNDDRSTTPAPIIKKTVAFNNPMITASSTSGKTLTLNGIDIDGDDKANTGNGGGIYVPENGKLTLTNTTIQNCKAANGAGIYCRGTITFGTTGKVEIKSNTASLYGGGIYYNNTTYVLTLNSTVVIGDTTSTQATLTSHSNEAKYGGGLYISENCTVKLENTKILRNYATNYGGGICSNGTLQIMPPINTTTDISYNSLEDNNESAYGGGVYASGTLAFGTNGNINISANTAGNKGMGGGIYYNNNAALTLPGKLTIGQNITDKATSTSKSNSALYGGGIYLNPPSSCTVTVLRDCKIMHNYAYEEGGGIYSSSGVNLGVSGTVMYNGAPSGKAETIAFDGTTIELNSDSKLDNSIYTTKAIKSAMLTNANKIQIIPSSYTDGREILSAATGVTLAFLPQFFTVKDSGSAKYCINPEGKLQRYVEITGTSAAFYMSMQSNTYYKMPSTATVNGISGKIKAINQAGDVSNIVLDLSECTELPILVDESSNADGISFNGSAYKTIILPSSPSIIYFGTKTFNQATNLETIIVYNRVTAYANSVYKCTNLRKIYVQGTKDFNAQAIVDCPNLSD